MSWYLKGLLMFVLCCFVWLYGITDMLLSRYPAEIVCFPVVFVSIGMLLHWLCTVKIK